MASLTIDANTPVTVGWSPNAAQPQSADIAAYNVYRGTPADSGGITWTLIASPQASTFVAGGAASDTGQAGTPQTPPLNSLATYFDDAIEALFAYYAQAGNALVLSIINTSPTAGTSWVYSFSGTTVTDPVTSLECLQFAFTGAVDAATQQPIGASDLPFPAGTPCNIYYPYWSSNTFDGSNPAPPAWTPYPTAPASAMVFAANGVFADNLNQVYYNLPSQVPPPPPPPNPPTLPVPGATTPAGIWQSLLATLENRIVAALTRGIAAPVSGALPIAPLSWASQPSQMAPAPSAQASSLTQGTTYYYVVTSLNGTDESAPSLEFTAVPSAANPSVEIQWTPLETWQASAFNVYRGTASQAWDTLVTTVQNDGTSSSAIDSGGGSAGSPPTYYPKGATSSDHAAFFHQPSVSINGGAYASPFDDQGNQSSTLSSGSVTSLAITIGPWGS